LASQLEGREMTPAGAEDVGAPRRPILTRDLRRIIIECSHKAHVGHISSGLSVCEILAVLYGKILRHSGTRNPDRDRFILSKGHAALALYAALHLIGVHSREKLDAFCQDGSPLGVHPEHELEGVEVSTGSLGMGLSIGIGMALAARLDGAPVRVYVLLSDAECNEGSVWESVMFAGHHRLVNLIAIVEQNGMQAMGPTQGIIDQSSLRDQWAAFGWDALRVDGHDETLLLEALQPPAAQAKPRVVIARTTPGKGVSFIENRLDWHYYPLTDAQASQALREIADVP
jgi:transketolase